MKKIYFKRHLIAFMVLIMSLSEAWAQNGSIAGKVQDETGETLPGVSVVIESTRQGSATDIDGNYKISNVAPGTYVVIANFIGYEGLRQSITVGAGQDAVLNFKFKSGSINLNETVVIGYGAVAKKDLTGSVTSINSKDFNAGAVSTPEQLITGKIAGVQITSNGGAPGSGSRIRIRGGTSLNASNDPLYVIDGVPVDNGAINGAPNPLSLINPNDIENYTVLKDASASAIYGSRAANGVILITTKKGALGDGKVHVGLNTLNSLSKVNKFVDVLSADEFRKLVTDSGTATQIARLGKANTNWQNEIYQTAFTTDNNISITGGIKQLPYRVGIGYLNQEGVLKTSKLERIAPSLNLSPSFFKNTLKVDVNAKYSYSENRFADQGAIGTAVGFDPTQEIRSNSPLYGGFFEYLTSTGRPDALSPRNPVGLLEQRKDISEVNRFLGNIALDYKIPFIDGLRANLNLATDRARGKGSVLVEATSAIGNLAAGREGTFSQYKQEKNNDLIEFYLNYVKEIKSIKSRIDLTGGYSFQNFETSSPSFDLENGKRDTILTAKNPFGSFTDNALLSVYGRLNYNFMERYLLTVTLRNDGSSRFAKDVRFGLFPSVAFAWRAIDEKFIKSLNVFSDLKVRLGYGIVGQQEIFSDYPYIANFTQGEATSGYIFGNTFYTTLRPDPYDPFIKWEETATYNAGIDFGFFNNRIYGTVDYYEKYTSDLINTVTVSAGGLSNRLLTNVGSIENKGIELGINIVPIANKNVNWELGFNLTRNRNKITKINLVTDEKFRGILTGGIAGGTGLTIQNQNVGLPINSFYVLEQKYDANGNPIEGQFTNFNGDVDSKGLPIINDNDFYWFKNPEPKLYFGFNSNVSYKKWSLGFVSRAQFGNYLYNQINAERGNYANIDNGRAFFQNLNQSYFDSKFEKFGVNTFRSDYYIEDATFFRMDNINLGYNFGRILNNKASLKASFVVQNVFTITNYSGLDPEVSSGIDNNIYPRPTVYSFGLNFQL